MRLKALSVILLLLISGYCYPQYHTMLDYGEGKSLFSATATLHAGSNSLTNQHFFRLRKGGHLSAAFLDDIENSLTSGSAIGGYSISEITVLGDKVRCWGRDSLYITANAGYHQFQELLINRSAASVAFHGNLRYEGDTLDIGPLLYQNQKYHQWKLGLTKVSAGTNGRFYAGFTAGINLGLQQMMIDISEASLYTAPYGEYLELHTQMQFSRSAPETFSPSRIQGVGPALDFFYAWIPDKGTSVYVSFSQLGFIIWNNRSYSYQHDTTFIFEGIVIDNVFNVPDTWDSGLTNDTLDHWFNRHGKPHRHYTSLPLTFHLAFSRHISDYPLLLRGEVLYRHQTLMKPYFVVSLDWKPVPRLIISRSYAYGGYNSFTTGLTLKANLFSGWWLTLGSNGIYPAVSPNAKLNLHLFGGLQYRTNSTIAR